MENNIKKKKRLKTIPENLVANAQKSKRLIPLHFILKAYFILFIVYLFWSFLPGLIVGIYHDRVFFFFLLSSFHFYLNLIKCISQNNEFLRATLKWKQ